MGSNALKTIGHSNHPIETFLDILYHHHINCIIDLRSAPYSRHNPQFNRETLKTDLEINEIEYIFMGDRLGARQEDKNLIFDNGKVDFDKVKDLPSFIEGIESLINKTNTGLNISLMCAEKAPLNCHRFMLVSRALAKKNIDIEHLLSDKSTVSQEKLEERLLNKYTDKSQQMSLFEPLKSRTELLNFAYKKHNMHIGYTSNPNY
jgi:uncharacterized protein (DUF488 family)